MTSPRQWTYLYRSPAAFLSDLAKNASIRDVHVVIYSGNDDASVEHFGTEGA